LSSRIAQKTGGRGTADYPELRAALGAYRERTGENLREIGRQAGVSHAMLSRFLGGAQMRVSTAVRLRLWLQGPPGSEELLRLLDRELKPLGARRARELKVQLAGLAGAVFAQAGLEPPSWVAELGRRVAR